MRGRSLLAVALLLGSMGGWAAEPTLKESTDHLLQAAKQAVERCEFASARTAVAKAVEAEPDNVEVLFLAARTARRARDYDRAREYLDRYLKLRGRPDNYHELEQMLLTA